MNIGQQALPERIICLTEETTEVLYALDADERIVGISGFTVRPAIARKTKPKISTYLSANIEQILELQPDIVLAWSDLQADIVAQLIRHNIPVWCFNQRSIQEIFSMIAMLGALVGKNQEAEHYSQRIASILLYAKEQAAKRTIVPKVYFEEWFEPRISGSRWISEIIELCGGNDICKHRSLFPDAKRRIIDNDDEILTQKPDIMLASWCGKKFKPEKVRARIGWQEIPAVQNDAMFALHSSVILQPGPAALTEGVERITEIFDQWAEQQVQQS